MGWRINSWGSKSRLYVPFMEDPFNFFFLKVVSSWEQNGYNHCCMQYQYGQHTCEINAKMDVWDWKKKCCEEKKTFEKIIFGQFKKLKCLTQILSL